MKVLVVEDDAIEAIDIRQILESVGYEAPAVVSSGEEAIKRISEINPDLVLMDIILKGKVDGIEAAEKIRLDFDVPVVYLTAISEEETMQRAKLTEPYGYLIKPFTRNELKNTIDLAFYKYNLDKKLRKSEKSYRELAENIQGIVYRVLIMENWRMQFFNDMVKDMTGFTPEELRHGDVCSIDPLIVPEDREHVIKTVKSSIKSKKPFIVDYRIKHKDGGVKYFRESGKPIYGDNDEPLYIDGVIFDITETKKLELELENAYKSWEETINAIEDGICLIDQEGTFLWCNLAMETLLERPSEEFLGKKCWEVIHNSKKPIEKCPIVKLWKSRKRETLETLIDGKWFKIIADPIFSQNGELTGAVHILTDINESKEAEKQLIKSLEEKNVLLREIHHRVKNNLQIISSLLNLQSRHIRDDYDLEVFMESQNRVKSMALIHEGLYQSQEFAHINMAKHIKTLALSLCSSYHVDQGAIKLKTNIQDVKLGVDTAIPLSLIINELISNSIKHAFPEGQTGEINIDLMKIRGKSYKLTMNDNGVGFPEDLDFQKTDTLGLQLVNNLVEQLDGTIKLDRTNGTQFNIEFNEQTYKER